MKFAYKKILIKIEFSIILFEFPFIFCIFIIFNFTILLLIILIVFFLETFFHLLHFMSVLVYLCYLKKNKKHLHYCFLFFLLQFILLLFFYFMFFSSSLLVKNQSRKGLPNRGTLTWWRYVNVGRDCVANLLERFKWTQGTCFTLEGSFDKSVWIEEGVKKKNKKRIESWKRR